MEKNIKLYNEYLESCYALHYDTKNTTYVTYKSYMTQFIKYLKDKEDNAYLIDENTIKNIVPILERYINFCREKGNHTQNIKNKIVALSAFYKWCVRRSKIEYHPFADKLQRPIVKEYDKVRKSYYLTWKEIYRVSILMETMPKISNKNNKTKFVTNKKQFDLKSRLLWELLIDSGFRITPIFNLKVSQLDLESSCFINTVHKGGKVRNLYFFETAKKILIEYLEERRKLHVDTDYLFYVKHENKYKQMSKIAIRKRIRKIGNLLGIEDFYPHTIRKTVINNINKITDLKTASEFAGHNSTLVTENYYIQKHSAEFQRDKIRMAMMNNGLL